MRNLTVRGELYSYRIQHLDAEGAVLVDEPTYSTNGPQAHRLFRERLQRDDILTGDQLVLLHREGTSENWTQVEVLIVEQGNDDEYFADMESGEDFERQDFANAS